MHKKMLNKINIYHQIIQYFNYLLIQFIIIKTNKMIRKSNILCIHINFNQKIENFTKIHVPKKIIDNKKKRDLNLAFLTYLYFLLTLTLLFLVFYLSLLFACFAL